jgi:CBS domain-containing protein
MLVSVIADGIAMYLMPKSSIMTEKLARRGMRIHTDYETDVLQQVSVEDVMDRDLPAISSGMSVAQLAERIARRDPEVSRHEGLLILDADGRLEGIITRSDILRAFEKDGEGKMSVLDAGTRDVVITHPDELLHDAAAKMLRRNVGRLPVVERADSARVVGYLGRQGIMSARLRRLDEEHVREVGWASRFSRRRPSL